MPLSIRLGRRTFERIDPWLVGVLLVAFAFCLHGLTWGRFEDWNPDQMALKPLLRPDAAPLRPMNFLKPPFYTYLNFFGVFAPLKVAQHVFGWSEPFVNQAILIGCRLLMACLFAGSAALLHAILRPTFGRLCAVVSALLFATSAGLVAGAHYLTTDVPLTFWTLFAFFWATRILARRGLLPYVACGVCVGLAAATKYNGLAIGLALVGAHGLAWLRDRPPMRALVLDRRLLLGLLAIPSSFLLANPYALIDARAFVLDFLYNYVTTPIYDGVWGGHSYGIFLLSTTEVFGLPLTLLLAGAAVFALVRLSGTRPWSDADRIVLLAVAVFAVYYAKMGAFPRWETRFGLPVMPLLLVIAAPFWTWLGARDARAALVAAAPFVLYGAVCSGLVGSRFLADPRIEALDWVEANVPPGSVIESSSYVPHWERLGVAGLEDMRMPGVSGRAQLLGPMLSQPWALDRLRLFDPEDRLGWFTPEALAARSPDFVALNARFYDRFLGTSPRARLYPELGRYLRDLLCQRLGYVVVFNRATLPPPGWAYPVRIDYLDNRQVILRRGETAAPVAERGTCAGWGDRHP